MPLIRFLPLALLTLFTVGCRSMDRNSASRDGGDDAVILVSKDTPRGESVELEAPHPKEPVSDLDAKRKSSGWGRVFGNREAMPRTDLKANTKETDESSSGSSFASGF